MGIRNKTVLDVFGLVTFLGSYQIWQNGNFLDSVKCYLWRKSTIRLILQMCHVQEEEKVNSLLLNYTSTQFESLALQACP